MLKHSLPPKKKLPQKTIDTPFGGFIILFFENLSVKSQVFMGFTAPKSSFQRNKTSISPTSQSWSSNGDPSSIAIPMTCLGHLWRWWISLFEIPSGNDEPTKTLCELEHITTFLGYININHPTKWAMFKSKG